MACPICERTIYAGPLTIRAQLLLMILLDALWSPQREHSSWRLSYHDSSFSTCIPAQPSEICLQLLLYICTELSVIFIVTQHGTLHSSVWQRVTYILCCSEIFLNPSCPLEFVYAAFNVRPPLTPTTIQMQDVHLWTDFRAIFAIISKIFFQPKNLG